jgi:methyl-accepting chemotaxis protein
MVEEHVSGVIRALRVIAASDEAKAGSWDEVKPLLERFSEDLTTDATTWFAHPDGRYFSTASDDVAEENLKDRDYFPALMSGKEVFGDLVISKSTGHRSVIIATPVKKDDKTIGAVGVSLRVRLLSELVNSALQLPTNTYFYALEGDTRIVLHRNAERMFKTPSDVGDEALGAEFKRVLEQKSGTFDYELHGKRISSIFELSPKLGWYFFIARELEG